MAWTVGQTVGQITGSIDRRILRGTVTKVTPSGRATVTFTRHDGGKFERTFDAAGSTIPKSRHQQRLTPWDADSETRWKVQDDKYASNMRLVEKQRSEEQIERAKRNAAIAYLRELIEDDSDSRADDAREMLNDLRDIGQ